MTGSRGGSLDPHGPVAESMADLWWFMLALGVIVFLIFAVLLVVGLFRRRDATDPREDEPTPKRLGGMIVAGGVALPVVIVSAVFAATVVAMQDVSTRAPPDALEIEIVGHQWWWEVRYPAVGVTTANEVHLPVGRPIAFRLTSADVIHSFWVPALAGKMDLLPDRVNTLVLEADVAGRPPQRVRRVLRAPARPDGSDRGGRARRPVRRMGRSATAGRPPTRASSRPGPRPALFVERDCAKCHTIRGTPAAGTTGPDLTHVASRSEIAAGARPNTPADLAEWITDPHTIKDGVEMPATQLSPAEIGCSGCMAEVARMTTADGFRAAAGANGGRTPDDRRAQPSVRRPARPVGPVDRRPERQARPEADAHRLLLPAARRQLRLGHHAASARGPRQRPRRAPQLYNELFTNHGTVTMFLVILPIFEGFAILLLPLLLGTRELPFPRLGAFSFWAFLFGGLLYYSSALFKLVPDAGWFAYTPLSGPTFSPDLALDFWVLGLGVAEVAAISAAIEFIIGILKMRAPGMTLSRHPAVRAGRSWSSRS